jgi:hypothetical protein
MMLRNRAAPSPAQAGRERGGDALFEHVLSLRRSELVPVGAGVQFRADGKL